MCRVRQLEEKDKVCEQINVRLLAEIYPREVIEQCVGGSEQWQSKQRRVRQSTVLSLVWLLIAMALWSRESQRRVWLKLTGVLHDLHPGKAEAALSASAISNRRVALGDEGMHRLMQRCCRPLATPASIPEAFFGRYRLMAIDGTLFVTPDTAANEEAFGRSSNQFGKGAYPQVRCVVLCECGTHAIVGVERSCYDVSEVHGAHRLLEQVGADTVVLVDAGITSGGFVEHVRARRAHLLAALEAGAWETPEVRRLLPDGSVLAWIPVGSSRVCYPIKQGFWIRIIAYQLTDERLGEPDKRYRLVTTLLNPRVAPAAELIAMYHDRWEVELVLDEIKTHQRAHKKVLRSKTPMGVLQELDGLFLAHYAIRACMARSASRMQLDPDRLSFTESHFHVCELLGLSLLLEGEGLTCWLTTRLHERITQLILPERILRINRREVKQIYCKYKPKKRNVPPPDPFLPHEQFLDFVLLTPPPPEWFLGHEKLK